MHSILEEFLIVLTEIPTVLLHLLTIYVEVIRIVLLWVGCHELTTFCLSHLNEDRINRTCKLTRLTENHIPDIVGNH